MHRNGLSIYFISAFCFCGFFIWGGGCIASGELGALAREARPVDHVEGGRKSKLKTDLCSVAYLELEDDFA